MRRPRCARSRRRRRRSRRRPTRTSTSRWASPRARSAIVPDMLRPSCADMDAVRATRATARLTRRSSMIARPLHVAGARKLLDRDARSDAVRDRRSSSTAGCSTTISLTRPRSARSGATPPRSTRRPAGSSSPSTSSSPSSSRDDATWRAFPWFSHYDRARLGAKTTLFRVGERSFVLVFPETAAP